jgi:hypothetical protein
MPATTNFCTTFSTMAQQYQKWVSLGCSTFLADRKFIALAMNVCLLVKRFPRVPAARSSANLAVSRKP